MAEITEAQAIRITHLCAAIRSDRALVGVLKRTKEVEIYTIESRGSGEYYDKSPVSRGKFVKSSRIGATVVNELTRFVELRIDGYIRELHQLNAAVPAEKP